MAGNAFTAGVKPGGLTTSTEIRILLCYLIQHAGTPLSQGELETALLGEELVNYFELASNLSDLLEQGFVREENGRYTILPAGAGRRRAPQRTGRGRARHSGRAAVCTQRGPASRSDHARGLRNGLQCAMQHPRYGERRILLLPLRSG